jgi:hypothetical protein
MMKPLLIFFCLIVGLNAIMPEGKSLLPMYSTSSAGHVERYQLQSYRF